MHLGSNGFLKIINENTIYKSVPNGALFLFCVISNTGLTFVLYLLENLN